MKLAPGLELPLDAITQTLGILAVRGAGKSNLAAVMAEEMFDAGLPFVVVDPVGAWWGLRSSSDGKSAGLPIPVFGGRHGDVPLEKTGGQVLADLVVDDRLSCILDISEFSEGDKIRFLIDFAERLYRRNAEPLHLFLEEADDYAPQRPFRDQARLLRAWENVVRRGRARGLGITLITQRSAALNKNVLTQIETLFVLRTTSPQDRKAIEGWVEYHGQKRELLESLPQLAAGEAWVWSPSWLKLTKRVQIRRRRTFDSGATPKNVKGSRRAATLADVDLVAVKARMAATIERAKQEDPRALRMRIAELERQIVAKSPPAPPKPERIEIPAMLVGDMMKIEAFTEAAKGLTERVQALQERILKRLERYQPHAAVPPQGSYSKRVLPTRPAHEVLIRPPRVPQTSPATVNGGLPRAERRILTALAQYPTGRTKRQIALLAGYAIAGGGFQSALGALSSRGMIERPGGDLILATREGIQALGDGWSPLPHGQALLEHWKAQLGRPERLILEALANVYPAALTKERLAMETGYEATGGGFQSALGRLRTLELINGRSELRVSEDLF